MALGDLYATLALLRSRMGITDPADTTDDAKFTAALGCASRGIENVCRRQFNDAGSATARQYATDRGDLVLVDDFHTTTPTVAIDTAANGSYGTAWSASDYLCEPLDGVVDGVTGWPWWRIRARSTPFPTSRTWPGVRVTARWGWPAVPAPIGEACLIVAAEIAKLSDAPFGVAGFGEYGAVRVRQNPIAMAMIAPYRRRPVLVA